MTVAACLGRARRASTALAGGGAPMWWQRATGQRAAWLPGLRRASAWLAESAGPVPRLNDGPLFGHALALLTETVALCPQARLAPRHRGSRAAAPSLAARRDRAVTPAPRPTPRPPAPAGDRADVGAARGPYPGRLERRAGLEVLRRAAGEVLHAGAPMPAGRRDRRAALQRAERGARSPHQTFPAALRRGGGSSSDAGRSGEAPPATPGAHREWLRRLVHRAQQTFIAEVPVVTTVAAAAPILNDAAAASDATATFAAAAATLLDGPEAAAELLRRWHDHSPPGDAGRRAAAPSPSRSAEQHSAAHAGAFPAVPRRDATTRANRAADADLSLQVAPFVPDASALATGAVELRRETAVLEVIRPLPPLIPPQVIGRTVPPAAAATARRGTTSEAFDADEDLDQLAAKIKRILDEEARRYGIDV